MLSNNNMQLICYLVFPFLDRYKWPSSELFQFWCFEEQVLTSLGSSHIVWLSPPSHRSWPVSAPSIVTTIRVGHGVFLCLVYFKPIPLREGLKKVIFITLGGPWQTLSVLQPTLCMEWLTFCMVWPSFCVVWPAFWAMCLTFCMSNTNFLKFC